VGFILIAIAKPLAILLVLAYLAILVPSLAVVWRVACTTPTSRESGS